MPSLAIEMASIFLDEQTQLSPMQISPMPVKLQNQLNDRTQFVKQKQKILS